MLQTGSSIHFRLAPLVRFCRVRFTGRSAGSLEQITRRHTTDSTGESKMDVVNKVFEMIQKKLPTKLPSDTKVVDFKHPKQLQELLKLDISKTGSSETDILKACNDVIDYSVKTSSPFFFNQLYTGVDRVGMAGAIITEALNTNEHTFEVAPAFVMITDYVIRELCKTIGYPDGDGVFMPGGSMAIFMSLHLARYNKQKNLKETGLFSHKRMTIFTSEDSHYSLKKAVAFLGFGTDSLYHVKTDDKGRMIPSDLRAKIKMSRDKGEEPLYVMGTSGTTVLGAFDPLNDLADICQDEGLWLHVDACWGGGAMFSSKHRHLVTGIERTDSLSISLHKLMAAPLQCSPLLVKQKGLLQECNGVNAAYLFQPDKYYDNSFDIGDKTVQCGRKADGFKFWLLWKARGQDGMAAHVDNLIQKARYFEDLLRNHEGFRLVLPENDYCNVSFWYIPPSMRGQKEDEEWWNRLHLVAPKIKAQMALDGSMLIGHQTMQTKGYVNFFRIIIGNAILTNQDLEFVVSEIDRIGQNL